MNPTVREAWLWLGGSLLLAVLWTNLVWLFSPWVDREEPNGASTSLAERTVSRVANWRFAPSLYRGLRMLYYVGLPAAALFWGRDAIVSRLFGLQRLALPASVGIASTGALLDANWSDWVHDLGWAAALGLGLGALLLLAAFAHRRALFTIQCDVRRSNTPAWRTAREAVYREVHWAFYRNAPVVAFGSYWGTWAGLALVAFEAMINPLWREGLREPGLAWSRVSQGALLIVSSLLYLHTQNLWLALPVHWGISQVLEKVYTAPGPVPSDAVSSGK